MELQGKKWEVVFNMGLQSLAGKVRAKESKNSRTDRGAGGAIASGQKCQDVGSYE